MTAATINSTPDQVSRMVRLSFGEIDPNDPLISRYHDVARDALAGRVAPENDAAAAFLQELRDAAEEIEAKRVEDITARMSETAEVWSSFVERRAAASATPAGFRDVLVRDEASKKLLKLRVPIDWLTEV